MRRQVGRNRNLQASDGTTELLQWGGSILGAGVLSILALLTILGGVGPEGARNNAGWLALIIGAMCLPFGLMLTMLGVAKWLRRRSLEKQR
jgi:amino acid transporter